MRCSYSTLLQVKRPRELACWPLSLTVVSPLRWPCPPNHTVHLTVLGERECEQELPQQCLLPTGSSLSLVLRATLLKPLMPRPCRPQVTACKRLGHSKLSSLPKSHAQSARAGIQVRPPFSPPELCFLVAVSHLTWMGLPNRCQSAGSLVGALLSFAPKINSFSFQKAQFADEGRTKLPDSLR